MTLHLPWVPDTEPADLEIIHPTIEADPAALADVVEQLRRNPGRQVAWSRHASRGAARQRVAALRQSRRFEPYPDVLFETRSVLLGDPSQGVYILVSVPEERSEES